LYNILIESRVLMKLQVVYRSSNNTSKEVGLGDTHTRTQSKY
jgi:hypothetical protein